MNELFVSFTALLDSVLFFDILFGTFKNPKEYVEETGFYFGASSKIKIRDSDSWQSKKNYSVDTVNRIFLKINIFIYTIAHKVSVLIYPFI